MALRGFIGALLVAGVLAWAWFVSACSRHESPLASGRVIDGKVLPGYRGDDRYAEVRADALPAMFDVFSDTISRLGLVKWDARFDCNHFADLYVSAAQVRYAATAWHSETSANTLALAVVWYQPASGGRAHAIVELRTDRGTLYVDPLRGGGTIDLSPREIASISFRKW